MAHVAIFERMLEPSSASNLPAASVTRASSDLPTLRLGALDDEGRETFLEDYAKLRRWQDQGHLTRGDTRDAAAIAHMWLCDRQPLLSRFADHYGLQMSLPDLHPLRAYSELARESNPVFMYHEDRWEGNWLAPSLFLNDLAFWLAEHRPRSSSSCVTSSGAEATSIPRTESDGSSSEHDDSGVEIRRAGMDERKDARTRSSVGPHG
jgi:hypothetical protein